MSDACTWPEQDAVDAWLEKHGIKVEFKQAMELKEAVTAYRIKVQSELDSMRAQQTEAPVNVASLSDDEIVRVLHSLGIDTYPSKYGFPEKQVSATNVPMIRKIVAAYLAAAPAPVQTQQSEKDALRESADEWSTPPVRTWLSDDAIAKENAK